MEELAPGIFSWTAPHPEWRPKVEEVVSYALVAGEALLVVDPLLPSPDDARRAPLLSDARRAWSARPGASSCSSRSPTTRAAPRRCTNAIRAPCTTLIWGHPGVKKRLTRLAPLEVIPQSAAGEAAEIAGGAALAYTIGRPRRSEYPLLLPGAARRRLRRRRGRAPRAACASGTRARAPAPTGTATCSRPRSPALAAQDIEYVLVTHGPPVLADGRRALAECLAAAPVSMY